MSNPLPNQLSQWQNLQNLAQQDWSLTALFAQDVNRAHNFSVSAQGIYFDYSKQCLDKRVKSELLALAKACQLQQKIKALYRGDKVNSSEKRAALHTALRLPATSQLVVDGEDVVSAVQASLAKAADLVARIRQGIWRGYSGKAITDVVNIGVGGSDLGPVMASTALDEWADSDINVHFVSNMDGTQLGSLLERLNPETTLFIVSSKSFGTVDTLSNAQTARAWLLTTGASLPSLLRRHFIGVSANPERALAWGIDEAHLLQLWDWVGGRFSMWSSIGLAVAIRIGMARFYDMLAGAHAMDEHFVNTDFETNLPVLLGLIGVWNSTFLGINAHTVLPYDGRLKYLPSYLTQLEMESNGKSVTHTGEPVTYSTCPILWGEIGSNAQHAFYQLLHQGTQKVSCDFIACVHYYDTSDAGEFKHQHALSLANCLAQSRVLAFGNDAVVASPDQPVSRLDKFKRYRGNQPSTTLLLDELTPTSFGALIALYEHKVFVMASIWDINPFDQWGVEMGKQVANEVFAHIHCQQPNHQQDDGSDAKFDGSTQALLDHINQQLDT
ncbi:glucose-6-phosphate isomerase [Psychrobacter lutiphocae]|uniref:glucose-6-phosphate isomerase n=1 Tax=Psychrobacter lutiphocae TaxID=540500 RepID=UPI00036C247A|nr:glucose-6-phosphate isomerase [Psychrobacter lutiphocae]